MKTKRCSGECKQTLPITAFNKDRATGDGLTNGCRECERARYKRYHEANKQRINAKRAEKRAEDPTKACEKQRAWVAKNPGHYRRMRLKSKYGITESWYDALFNAQDGRCAICREVETMIRNGKPVPLCVDHDHATGKIRELLCYKCNTAVAMIREDPDIARAVIRYLEQHKPVRLAAHAPRA